MEIEEPVAYGYSPAFHLHPTLSGMVGAPLIWYQGQGRQAREQRLLAVPGAMQSCIANSFPIPLDSYDNTVSGCFHAEAVQATPAWTMEW